MWITAPSGLIRQRNGGVSFEVVIHVRGGGDLVNGQVNVYDGNNLQPLTYKYGPIYDNRGTDTRTAPFSFKPRDGAPSAYFVCGYAIISAGGITSVNAPWSSCSWLRVDQVLYGRWTNRKTCASPDDPMGAASWMTSVRAYGGERVDFRDACGVRDSGYRGIVVQEPVTGKWYDFRTWSRAQVDQLFHQLLDLACRTQIPNSRRYAAARSAFLPYFDADLTAAGIQVSTNPAALPQGVSGTTPDRCAWAPGWSSARASM